MKQYQKFIHMEILNLGSNTSGKCYVIILLDHKDEVVASMETHPIEKWYFMIGNEGDDLPVCLN